MLNLQKPIGLQAVLESLIVSICFHWLIIFRPYCRLSIWTNWQLKIWKENTPK